MRIAAVGRAFEGSTDNFQFSSTQSFLDYDLLVLDLGHAKHEYNTNLTSPVYQGLPSLNDTSSAAIRRDIPRRKSEILDMLKLGRTVIVFTPASQAVFAATGETKYSGTGKNSRATRIVNTIDLLTVLPVAVHTVEASGESIEFRGQEPFNNFWASQGRFLFYEAYFQVPIGNGLFYIKGTNRVVGAYMSMEKGNLLFLPSFAYDQFFKTTKDYQNAQRSLIQSVVRLSEDLKRDTGNFSLPSWAEKYLLPNEEHEKKVLIDIESSLAELLTKISEQKEVLATMNEFKLLVTGTGRALEMQVARVFENLGFTVAEGLPGRGDLILEYQGTPVVVEVKSSAKSAAEKHAAQLEKWVSEYYAEKGANPKAILIVNAYKDTPLVERTEVSFPSQMLSYSTCRGHCLMTTTQLLDLSRNLCKLKPDMPGHSLAEKNHQLI